ncbi:MAG: delta-60 repeat domain-containing protein, partial [Desulfovibrionales bacterium]
MHSTKVWIRILLFVAWAAGLQSAWAAPGDQDTSFGDDGWVITDLGGDETGTAVAVQPSGRIILAGTRDSVNEDFALVGYFENGTLDQSFGDQGSVAIDFRGKDDSARDVMVLPEGSIVVAGTAFTDTNQDFA